MERMQFFKCLFPVIMFDLIVFNLMYRSSSLEESIKSMSLSPEEDDIPWKDLRDNRDLTVLFNWDPKDR